MSLLSPQLEAFMMVVQHGTVHAAADTIHITQTAVTQRIKALETRLKSTLFIRSRRGMEMTPEGEALLRYCHAAKALEGEAMSQIQGIGTEIDVHLGISAPTSIMHARIIPVCGSLMVDYPNVLFDFQVNDRETHHHALKTGRCDFAVMQKQDISDAMSAKQLKPEHYVLVCTAKWHGRRLKEIIEQERIIDFNADDKITLSYLKEYELLSHARSGRYFVNYTDMIADLVAQGVGYSTMSREFAKPYVDAGALMVLNQGKSYAYQTYLVWYDRPEPTGYFEAVVEGIK